MIKTIDVLIVRHTRLIWIPIIFIRGLVQWIIDGIVKPLAHNLETRGTCQKPSIICSTVPAEGPARQGAA